MQVQKTNAPAKHFYRSGRDDSWENGNAYDIARPKLRYHAAKLRKSRSRKHKPKTLSSLIIYTNHQQNCPRVPATSIL